MLKHCRIADIVADAAHAILTRTSRAATGNFYIDDEVLAAEGKTDLTGYAVLAGQPLLLDFFLSSGPGGSMDGFMAFPLCE